MPSSTPFSLIYAPVVRDHLRIIERKFHALIRQTIIEQLTFEPVAETRNRKPLKRPVDFEATWEIRFGPKNCFRVFYDVELVNRTVTILAIGVKEGSRLRIGGEEIDL